MQAQPQQIVPQHLWPTTIFVLDWPAHSAHAEGIEAHVHARAARFSRSIESGVATSAKPKEGLVESPLDFFTTTQDPGMRALVGWIDGCMRTIIAGVNGGTVPASRLKLDFTESWFHITNSGGFHDAHTHGACSWCGIFYLRAGDVEEAQSGPSEAAGNGINRFYSPLPLGGMVRDFGNAYLGRSYVDVTPQDGRMVIFPSYLLHSALPYTGARDRIVFAFNTRSALKQG